MALQPKSVVLVAATLVVGFALGLFTDARLLRSRRLRRPAPGDRSATLATRLGDVIQPHSPAQLDSLRPIMKMVADENTAMMVAASNRARAHMDSLRVLLAPMLDSAQRARLDQELSRMAARGMTARGRTQAGPSRAR